MNVLFAQFLKSVDFLSIAQALLDDGRSFRKSRAKVAGHSDDLPVGIVNSEPDQVLTIGETLHRSA